MEKFTFIIVMVMVTLFVSTVEAKNPSCKIDDLDLYKILSKSRGSKAKLRKLRKCVVGIKRKNKVMPLAICSAGNDTTPISGGRKDKLEQTSLRTLRCDDQVVANMLKGIGFVVVKGANKPGSSYKEPLERTVKFTFIPMPKGKKTASGVCTADDLKNATVIRSVSTGELVPSKTHPGRLIALKDVPKKRVIGYGKRIELRCTVPRHVVTVDKQDVLMPEKVKRCSAYLVNDGKIPAKKVVQKENTPSVTKDVKPPKDNDVVPPKKKVNIIAKPPIDNNGKTKPPVDGGKKEGPRSTPWIERGWSLGAIFKITAICGKNSPIRTGDLYDGGLLLRKQLTFDPKSKLNFHAVIGAESSTRYLETESGNVLEKRHFIRLRVGVEGSYDVGKKGQIIIGIGTLVTPTSSPLWGPYMNIAYSHRINKSWSWRVGVRGDYTSDGILPGAFFGFSYHF